jgi:hypothetical protein
VNGSPAMESKIEANGIGILAVAESFFTASPEEQDAMILEAIEKLVLETVEKLPQKAREEACAILQLTPTD